MSQVEPSGVCQGPPTAREYGTSGKAFERIVRELAYNEGLGVRSLLGRQLVGGRPQIIKMVNFQLLLHLPTWDETRPGGLSKPGHFSPTKRTQLPVDAVYKFKARPGQGYPKLWAYQLPCL